MNHKLIYILEYPIPNWAKDEIDEIKKESIDFRYTTIGQFDRKSHDPYYFYPRISYFIVSWIQILANPIRYFSIIRNYRKEIGLRIIIQTMALSKIMNRLKNIRIHCHFASASTSAALILHQLYGYQFGFTAHAWDIYLNTINYSTLREKLASAYYIRTISDYNKAYLIKLSPECKSKIKVIHCGINVSKFSLHCKKLNKDRLRIISASNFVEKKGYIQFIETFKEINAAELQFQWIIAGQGPLKNLIESTIQKYNLNEYIELMPPVQHEKLNDFFKEADIFLLPCTIASNGDRDGIPVILMEAMASGIITVSTQISGIPELIVHNVNGFILQNNHVCDLINIISYIKSLSRDELNAIRKNARNTIERNFNIKTIVKTHLEYINVEKF